MILVPLDNNGENKQKQTKSQYVPPPVNNSTTKMALTHGHAALRSRVFRTVA